MHLLKEIIAGQKEDLSWQRQMVPHVVANFSAMSADCGPTHPITENERDALSILRSLLQRIGRLKDE